MRRKSGLTWARRVTRGWRSGRKQRYEAYREQRQCLVAERHPATPTDADPPSPTHKGTRARHSRATFPGDRWGTPEGVRPCRPDGRWVWPVPRPHRSLKHELCQVLSRGQKRCGPQTTRRIAAHHILRRPPRVTRSPRRRARHARSEWGRSPPARQPTQERPSIRPDQRSGRIAARRGDRARRRAARGRDLFVACATCATCATM